MSRIRKINTQISTVTILKVTEIFPSIVKSSKPLSLRQGFSAMNISIFIPRRKAEKGDIETVVVRPCHMVNRTRPGVHGTRGCLLKAPHLIPQLSIIVATSSPSVYNFLCSRRLLALICCFVLRFTVVFLLCSVSLQIAT